MRRALYITITALLLLGAVAVWADTLPEAIGSCCEDCGDEAAGGGCCDDIVCCHAAQIIALVQVNSCLPVHIPVISRTDALSPILTIGELDRSLDLPPRTIPC